MRRSVQLDTNCLLKHGILMIALGTGVCALGSIMARPIREHAGYLFAAILLVVGLAAALLTPGLRTVGAPIPRRVTAAYIAVGLLMACYVAISAFQAGSLEMPLVGLLAAFLALFWASRFITLASTFHPYSPQAIGLCTLAAANSSLGVVLATRTGLSRMGIVTMTGCYVILLGVQVYLSAVVLYREVMHKEFCHLTSIYNNLDF